MPLLVVGFGCMAQATAQAQLLQTLNGKITFFSEAALEDITAENKLVAAALNPADGSLAFRLAINQFKFDNSLMQVHFNENYMESERYPIADFKGAIQNFQPGTLLRNGTHSVSVSGKLTMHGVMREISVPARLFVQGGNITATCTFNVRVADYGIEVPSIMGSKIAEVVRVDVSAPFRR